MADVIEERVQGEKAALALIGRPVDRKKTFEVAGSFKGEVLDNRSKNEDFAEVLQAAMDTEGYVPAESDLWAKKYAEGNVEFGKLQIRELTVSKRELAAVAKEERLAAKAAEAADMEEAKE
jgi:hypothetical protein